MLIKVVKIDVKAQTVTKLAIAPTLEAFYKEIGTDIIEPVRLDGFNTLYVDESGLLRDPIQPSFIYTSQSGRQVKLVGNAIICGDDSEGNWVDTDLGSETVRERIMFLV